MYHSISYKLLYLLCINLEWYIEDDCFNLIYGFGQIAHV